MFGSVNWQHQFGPALTGVAFLQYGVNQTVTANTPAPGNTTQNSNSLVLSLGLNHAFSETLNGSLQYSYTSQGYSNLYPYGYAFGYPYGPTPPQQPISLVLLSLRKTF